MNKANPAPVAVIVVAAEPETANNTSQVNISQSQRFLRRLLRNYAAVLGLLIVGFMVFIAVAAPWIALHDPDKQYSGRRLEPPSGEFPLGTDNLGRDTLSRLLYGARPSMGAAALATSVIVIIGIIVGAWAGYAGGLVDAVVMRVIDVLLAFPGLILALAIVGILGPGMENVLIAVISLSWAGYARLVRGLVLELRERSFVWAAVAVGASHASIVIKHIIPNVISPVIVLASLEMGVLILTIAALSFLGLGVQPPTSEWGAMLNAGKNFFQRAPQLMIYPGLMISLTVLGFNLIGDGLRDVFDPRHVG